MSFFFHPNLRGSKDLKGVFNSSQTIKLIENQDTSKLKK